MVSNGPLSFLQSITTLGRRSLTVLRKPTSPAASKSRRRFLQCAGAASLIVADRCLAADPMPAGSPAKGSLPKGKIPFDLGIATYTFREFPWEAALAMTARVGLNHVCLKDKHLPLNSTPAQIAAVLARAKLLGLEVYGGGVIYMKDEAEVERAFRYAKAAGMTTIVGVPDPKLLPLVHEKVQECDIRVAIHNHGPGDRVYPKPGDAYEKIKKLDRRVGLCIDVGHTILAGVDPIAAVRQCADRLLDMHLKDVTAATGSGKTIEAGRGILDFPQFLAALIEIGYSGFASFEFEKDPKDPLAGLAETVGYVRGALRTIVERG